MEIVGQLEDVKQFEQKTTSSSLVMHADRKCIWI